MTTKTLEQRHKQKTRIREAIKLLKDVPCMDCGKKYPSYVMDFDHRDPDTKEFGISTGRSGRGLKRVLEEIAKCDIVCANCHRIRTHSRL